MRRLCIYFSVRWHFGWLPIRSPHFLTLAYSDMHLGYDSITVRYLQQQRPHHWCLSTEFGYFFGALDFFFFRRENGGDVVGINKRKGARVKILRRLANVANLFCALHGHLCRFIFIMIPHSQVTTHCELGKKNYSKADATKNKMPHWRQFASRSM